MITPKSSSTGNTSASWTAGTGKTHDYAQIFIDGKYIGKLDRRNGEKQLDIPACKEGAQLDILVEAMGRINFGRAIKDFKGITGSVTLKNGGRTTELKGWKVYNLEDRYEWYKGLFETWGKGLVYVNGYGIGRIWEIGPQQTLYMPGCWLKEGENEILVFDIVGPKEARTEGLEEPILNQLLVNKPLTHRRNFRAKLRY